LTAPWLLAATEAERRAVALKILRIHGIGALLRRAAGTQPDNVLWNGAERRYWSGLLARLETLAGGRLPSLSRRDAALCRAAAKAGELQQLRAAVVSYTRAGRLGELATDNLLAMFSADSILRHYVAERRRTKSGVFTLG
jgi:hypothetical protein